MTSFKKFLPAIIALFIFSLQLPGQNPSFRSGIFLHHSTGANIYGPNGSNTSVPDEAVTYNQNHGYTGTEAVSLNETWFPVYNDNEWSTWHSIFEQAYPEDICTFCVGNPIIMIKSCFPSSSLQSAGSPADTNNPSLKTVYNYKWHWRHIIQVMENHPEHFFVIWTNAPLIQSQSNTTEASLSKWFCRWAKDTLAAGLDATCGAFPPNVYVFDFFNKVTNTQGFLAPAYAVSLWDSHPNAAATELVAPQLVNETFNASIAYETSLTLSDITGKLSYNDLSLTPMPGVLIQLKQACCIVVGSAYTDNAGNFSFHDVPPGYYNVVPVIQLPWGGVNAEDALIILKEYVGLTNLSGLPKLASNLDENHITNATDAFLAASRFVGTIVGFAVGDWIWTPVQINLTGNTNIQVQINALCTGDVDGSYMAAH